MILKVALAKREPAEYVPGLALATREIAGLSHALWAGTNNAAAVAAARVRLPSEANRLRGPPKGSRLSYGNADTERAVQLRGRAR